MSKVEGRRSKVDSKSDRAVLANSSRAPCRDFRLSTFDLRLFWAMTNSDSRVAVYTGSFDPITLGHLNVIERSSRLVDKLIVGIGINIEKQSLFTPEERVELVHKSIAHLDNVEVRSFSGLAVSFARD